MKKIMRLVGVQLLALLGDTLKIGNKKNNAKVIYGGIALFILLLGGVSFLYSFGIGFALKAFGSIHIMPAMLMAASSLIATMTTVLKVRGTIFGFKDYDMVMALPVKASGIATSRLILLYILNILFVCLVMIPGLLAYGILEKPGVLFYVIGLLTTFCIPLIPIVIASFLGTLIAYIASKFRYSNFVSIIISIVFLLGIIIVPNTIRGTEEDLANFGNQMVEQVNRIYPLSQIYTKALINYDILALLLFIGISIVAFLLYSYVIGKIFKKINTIIMTGKFKTNFKMKELKQSSPLKALYNKELKRYFSTNVYLLNTGFGIILLTLGTIALLFVDIQTIFSDTPDISEYIGGVLPLIIGFFISTSCTTMASISLEGKNLWVLKSLPVDAKNIFHAKLALNLTILVPVVLDSLLISMLLNIGLLNGFITVIVTTLFAIFIAIVGLVANLLFPNFNWTSEVNIIKQSTATFLSVFGGIIILGAFFVMYVIMQSALAYVIIIPLLGGVSFALYHLLMTWGVKRFQSF